MKTFPKILTIFFLTVFILQIICLFFLLTAPVASKAADIKFKPQVEIPGMSNSDEFGKAEGVGYTIPDSTAAIAKYIRVIYKYAIGVVGILAAVVLMLGGVLWLTAGGNTSRVTEAKAWITASLTGLVLALSSYLILATVNPALVNFKITKITSVEKVENIENDPRNMDDMFGLGKIVNGCCLYDYQLLPFIPASKFAWKECENLTNIQCNEKPISSLRENEFYINKICKKPANAPWQCENSINPIIPPINAQNSNKYRWTKVPEISSCSYVGKSLYDDTSCHGAKPSGEVASASNQWAAQKYLCCGEY